MNRRTDRMINMRIDDRQRQPSRITEEGAVENIVPIFCFCFKVRDDKNMEVGEGPWVDLNTYALNRQLPLSYGFTFSHGYCPDCVAHFNERMAAYRPTPVWGTA
jgi:hypothetical protein